MNEDNILTYKKVIWAFMLEHGRVTSGEWNYYGGHWEAVGSSWDWRENDKLLDEIRFKVKNCGVDWDATEIPDYEVYSAFTDTFNPSVVCECLIGVIHLNDQSCFKLGTNEASEAVLQAHKALRNLEVPTEEENLVRKYFG